MKPNTRYRAAFTLIELLASMTILGLMMVMLFSAFEQINKAWLQGENRVETFTQARAVLDFMSRELSQAIANKQITFHGTANSVYFVAPVNTEVNQADLCEVGYEFQQADGSGTWAFQLIRRLTEPTPANVAGLWNFYGNPLTWWSPASFDPAKNAALATNSIVNLQFWYWDPITASYQSTYNSNGAHNDKLPPVVQVLIDVVDSRTATRLRAVPHPVPTGPEWEPVTNSTLRSFSTIIYMRNTVP